MLRLRVEARVGLRWGVCSLATIVALLAVTSDPADARSRRKRSSTRVSHASSYSPPYSAIVVDANTGKVLHEASADGLRHPASLTKIMTLYLLFERLESGKLTLDSPLSISEHAAAQSPTKLGLHAGSTIAVRDAIGGMVTRSANDAAVVVGENLAGSEPDFGRMMTRKAQALGMSRTVYHNASGLPDDAQVTTARDQATLGRAIQERFPTYYKYFSLRSFVYHGQTIGNHNHLLGRIEGVDGIKTGYTNASGFNLVTSLHRDNRYIVAVVLGGASAGSRDARMRTLLDQYFKVASATKRGGTMLAEVAPTPAPAPRAETRVAAEPKAARYEVASAVSTPIRLDPPATVPAKARPAPGSTDPIRPVMVKTLNVKPGTPVHTASLLPFSLTSTARAPEPPAPTPETAPLALAKAEPVSAPAPVSATAKFGRPQAHGGWVIQVGAFPAEHEARQRLVAVKSKAANLLGGADPFTETVHKGSSVLYRARFAGLDHDQAEAACKYLKRNDVDCLPLKN